MVVHFLRLLFAVCKREGELVCVTLKIFGIVLPGFRLLMFSKRPDGSSGFGNRRQDWRQLWLGRRHRTMGLIRNDSAPRGHI